MDAIPHLWLHGRAMVWLLALLAGLTGCAVKRYVTRRAAALVRNRVQG